MTVRTRFAPSPTGFLHIGGARTALYNWLFARRNKGQFVLRVEDTDAVRSTDDSLKVILDGLKWLGLEWDEGPEIDGEFGPYYQSRRKEIYDAYLARLEESGLVYEDDGAVRFRIPDKSFTVKDVVCGDVSVNLKEQGSRRYDQEQKKEVEANPDLVIRRPDGSYIFHFVNVVDDIEMKISHVIRGEDHLSNTPKHLALFEAFGETPPTYAHIPLNLNPNGTKMSKRDQGALIHEYVENGFLPAAVNNYMALLGWSSKDDEEIFSVEELEEKFTLEGINKANSKFDYKKCLWVNAEHLRKLNASDFLEAATPFLTASGIDPSDGRIPAALDLAKDRAQLLTEVAPIVKPVFIGEIEWEEASLEKLQGREGVSEQVEALASGFDAVDDWSKESIQASIEATAEELQVKPGALMLPCRIAATGSTSGADLLPMLVLIGQEKTVARIRALAKRLVS